MVAIAARLKDRDAGVRMEAMTTLRGLGGAHARVHRAAVAARVEDSDERVALEAIKTLALLGPA